MSTNLLLRCYNKGCGKEYNEDENGEGNDLIDSKTAINRSGRFSCSLSQLKFLSSLGINCDSLITILLHMHIYFFPYKS